MQDQTDGVKTVTTVVVVFRFVPVEQVVMIVQICAMNVWKSVLNVLLNSVNIAEHVKIVPKVTVGAMVVIPVEVV